MTTEITKSSTPRFDRSPETDILCAAIRAMPESTPVPWSVFSAKVGMDVSPRGLGAKYLATARHVCEAEDRIFLKAAKTPDGELGLYRTSPSDKIGHGEGWLRRTRRSARVNFTRVASAEQDRLTPDERMRQGTVVTLTRVVELEMSTKARNIVQKAIAESGKATIEAGETMARLRGVKDVG